MTEAEIRRIFAKPPRAPRAERRSGLTARQRAVVLAKTAGTCHVCGGPSGTNWQADHVIPHERGGTDTLENYLPICRECNRLRWSYGPEVVRMILRFGILAKHEIRHDTKLGGHLLRRAMQRWPKTRARLSLSSLTV
jgi:5-methylcytosine-specific restriction endonuclease McrA